MAGSRGGFPSKQKRERRELYGIRWFATEIEAVNRAAVLRRTTLSSFVREAALKEAAKIIAQRSSPEELARVWVPRLFGGGQR